MEKELREDKKEQEDDVDRKENVGLKPMGKVVKRRREKNISTHCSS